MLHRAGPMTNDQSTNDGQSPKNDGQSPKTTKCLYEHYLVASFTLLTKVTLC